MKWTDCIAFARIAKELTGSKNTIRKNYVPKRFKPFFEDLKTAVESVINKHKL